MAPDEHAGIYRGGYLDPLPASLRPAVAPPTDRVRPIRPHLPGNLEDQLPQWAARLGSRPVVYLSLGTVPIFNRPEMFLPVLDGLTDLDVDVVVTVGHNNDPAALGAVPSGVHVERWLSLAALLPRCDAVVCHGGAGTTLAALSAGLPLVLLPRGADQFPTAAGVHSVGAGLALRPDQVTPAAIRDSVHAVLTDSAYRRSAAGVQSEIRAMPTADEVARDLPELAITEIPPTAH